MDRWACKQNKTCSCLTQLCETCARTLCGHLAAARSEGGADLLVRVVIVVLRVAAFGGAVLECALAGNGAAGRVAAVGTRAHLSLLGRGLLASKLLSVGGVGRVGCGRVGDKKKWFDASESQHSGSLATAVRSMGNKTRHGEEGCHAGFIC